jgi:DNA-binding NarL/FixJ family response regulator
MREYPGLEKSGVCVVLRILLIEDSETDAAIIKRAVDHHLHEAKCVHAQTLSAGERVLERDEVDVVLLDLGLPDSASPADTYKRVRKWAAKVPILVSTNLKDHSFAKSLLRDGAEDYLNKDLLADDPAHVREAIEFALERHGLLQKLAQEKEEAKKDSEKKDAMLNCFMGGYSIDNKH